MHFVKHTLLRSYWFALLKSKYCLNIPSVNFAMIYYPFIAFRMDDNAEGVLTQFWELLTMIPCAPKDF